MKKQRTKQRGASKRTSSVDVKAEVPEVRTYSMAEIRAKIANGEDRTDWARVDALTDADIDRAIASDPDAAPVLGKRFWDSADLLSAAAAAEKVPVTLRIDRDVVQCFRELGPGYQSRMNAVLRAYANAQKMERARNDIGTPNADG